MLIAVLFTYRSWIRILGLGLVAVFTLGAHTLVEPPQQIYGTWANNLSTDALLYTVDPNYMHNLFEIESPLLGALAAVLSIALTTLLFIAWAVAIRDARQGDARSTS